MTIDPNYPVERIDFMLSDSRASALLVHPECLERCTFDGLEVKIRGYRIELGEIMHHLTALPEVEEGFVRVHQEASGETVLCAYYVESKETTGKGLRKELSAHLPDYMIPTYFVKLPKFPLTANGKIDQAALPSPSETAYVGTEYVTPVTETEQTLAEIWKTLLNREVGTEESFFEVGGRYYKKDRRVLYCQP